MVTRAVYSDFDLFIQNFYSKLFKIQQSKSPCFALTVIALNYKINAKFQENNI